MRTSLPLPLVAVVGLLLSGCGAMPMEVGGGERQGNGGLSGPMACSSPNPAGCQSDSDCGAGQVCTPNTDPNVCISSACGCDDATDSWICTADCGGGVCVLAAQDGGSAPGCSTPSPAGCATDADCGSGNFCNLDVATLLCLPSLCGCDPSTDSWICTTDCAPDRGLCEPLPQGGGSAPTCSTPNPAGCATDAQCAPNEVCDRNHAMTVCIPSACGCDAATDSWICTADCNGGICRAP